MLNRILLLGTGLLAAYQIAIGIDGQAIFPLVCFTVAFGVLLVASMLLLILGMDVLESSIVLVISTLMPLSLSLGLVVQFLPEWGMSYMIFVILGLIFVILTRTSRNQHTAVLAVTLVHGAAGLLIFLLPIVLVLQGRAPTGYILVGFGGALIGVGGVLLTLLKTGRPILSKESILAVLPALFLLMTVAFVAGFAYI